MGRTFSLLMFVLAVVGLIDLVLWLALLPPLLEAMGEVSLSAMRQDSPA